MSQAFKFDFNPVKSLLPLPLPLPRPLAILNSLKLSLISKTFLLVTPKKQKLVDCSAEYGTFDIARALLKNNAADLTQKASFWLTAATSTMF